VQLGCERVVVGRELSVREIASVAAGSGGAEVEAFVHGALCVSYSGQCFSSESWGGRSANRGQCAQACRLEYGAIVDGTLQFLGDVRYLLSPQDLAAVELVPELVRAGVVSFKIEGEPCCSRCGRARCWSILLFCFAGWAAVRRRPAAPRVQGASRALHTWR
jgi:collagenase-like PrtC family protease